VSLPLAKFRRICNHGEYTCPQRSYTDAAQNRAGHRHCNVQRISHPYKLCYDYEHDTCKCQISLAKAGYEMRNDQHNDTLRDQFRCIDRAVQCFIAEHIFAVISRNGTGDRAHHNHNAPQAKADRPVLIREQCLQVFTDRNLLILCSFNNNALFNIKEADQQQNQRDYCKNYRNNDPALLRIAESLDQRKRRNCDHHLAHRTAENANRLRGSTGFLITRDQRSHSGIRKIECGIYDRVYKVIGNENINCLHHHRGICRNKEQCHKRDRIRHRHPQDPWSCLTVF